MGMRKKILPIVIVLVVLFLAVNFGPPSKIKQSPLDDTASNTATYSFIDSPQRVILNAINGVIIGGGKKIVCNGRDGVKEISLTLTQNSDFADLRDGCTVDFVINALNGNDIIFTARGNDYIRGDGGNDNINAGAGDDKIFGNVGNDKLYGGAGDDVIFGSYDNDELFGQDGDDVLCGGRGMDTIEGGEGENVAFGGSDIDDEPNVDNVDAKNGYAEGGIPVNKDVEDTVSGTFADVDIIEDSQQNKEMIKRVIDIMTKYYRIPQLTNDQLGQLADYVVAGGAAGGFAIPSFVNNDDIELNTALIDADIVVKHCRDPKSKGSSLGSGIIGIIGGNQN
jgi:Ca2+-binding RTX toxin-like protein